MVKLYQSGDLRFLVQDHQLEDFDDFWLWNEIRRTAEHIEANRAAGATYHNIWVDEIGRRWGKTAKWLVIAMMQMIRMPGSLGLIYTPLAKNIGKILVPLTRILFADAPAGYFPEFGTRGALGTSLYVPEVSSTCMLIGMDKNPDGPRGQALDFAVGTETAFAKGLHEFVTTVMAPTFSRRPHAWHALESSTAKVIDHDFNV